MLICGQMVDLYVGDRYGRKRMNWSELAQNSCVGCTMGRIVVRDCATSEKGVSSEPKSGQTVAVTISSPLSWKTVAIAP